MKRIFFIGGRARPGRFHIGSASAVERYGCGTSERLVKINEKRC